MNTWYVSYPTNAIDNAPVFFNALKTFASTQSTIKLLYPPHQDGNLELTKAQIASCDLVLVEVSAPSTGSGIELGWAHAADKPIIAFHQGGAEPTQALQLITSNIFVYITEAHILEALEPLL